MDIGQLRLHAQGLIHPAFKRPQDVVTYMGALQAQDFYGSKHAVGIRVPGLTEQAVDEAVNKGEIIRTWAFRGTLHLVTPMDIRWLVDLLKTRSAQLFKGLARTYDIDESLHKKCLKIITKAMQGNQHLTRKEITELLDQKGIHLSEHRVQYTLLRASLEGEICHGPMCGKQFSYALLDEWCAAAPVLHREEALAQLALRYFTSRGPATVADFSGWSGLTLTEARKAVEAVKHQLVAFQDYWMSPETAAQQGSSHTLLLPPFDEFILGYKDRSAVLEPARNRDVFTVNGIFKAVMVQQGKVLGTWKRTLGKNNVSIALSPFKALKKSQHSAFEAAAQAYAAYLQTALKSITVEQ
ncbi:winged helix DNA-binding domain-containing protein [Chitinophaga vietnamensis]|uniref:winged helix DNA-binding domain-containing protein n=1 Tax=Chitinophaga vietnamensis TaxID=2593957 RepID=UPI0011774733|nr:winged helix DNA-binding domain-containing protein [Chitinophaga vietnamensis]